MRSNAGIKHDSFTGSDRSSGRLDRFNLETLAPERLEAGLPDWLRAPTEIPCRLVRVPNVPQHARIAALNAWAHQSPYGRPSITQPVPPSLLPELPPATVAALLRHGLMFSGG